ncbi:YceH family protein [Shewanella sp. KX20019]|uniref:YceH family protein n=1 Tax=Shewanella sp. KX20019 TaxID=2803864 RepID=UPI001929052C|nr:YceH family protein [Shewanella sp. KX20019]QQX78505.1 YceH family protein [Shewanella sp. KX20019]
MELTQHEARIIGVLLEKELTTPEQYPLSLNSLTSGSNQKSSRDPVLNLSESDVQNTIDSLAKKRLISDQSGFGSRVVKYKHRFCNTEFSDLQLNPAQLAIICLLLLRGPQTPGELRTRSNRLHEFSDVSEVEHALVELARRETPLVALLAKEPGKREARYCQLFTPMNANTESSALLPVDTVKPSHSQQELSDKVAKLETDLSELKLLVQQLLAK